MLATLVRHRLRWGWRVGLVRSKRGLAPLVLVAVMSWIAWALVLMFRALGAIDPTLPDAFLTGLFPAASLLMVLGALGHWVQRLVDPELQILLAAPVPLGSLYLFRLGQVALRTLVTIGGLKLALVAAYGIATGAPAAFIPVAVVATTLLVAILTVVPMVGCSLLARFTPAGLLRVAIVALVPLQIVAYAMLGPVLRVSRFESSASRERARAIGALLARSRRHLSWSPTSWASDAIAAAQHGRAGAAVVSLVALAATAAALVAAGSAVYRRTFLESLDRAQVVRARRRTRVRLGDLVVRLLPRQVGAIVLKDWRTMARDLGLIRLLMMPTVMAGVFLVMAPRRSFGSVTLQMASLIPVVTMPAAGSFAVERDAYALLRSAPLAVGRLLAAKVVAATAPAMTLPLVVLPAVAVLTHAPVPLAARTLVAAVWLVGGAVIAAVAVAAIGARQQAAALPGGTRGRVSLTAIGLQLVFVLPNALLMVWLFRTSGPPAPTWVPPALVAASAVGVAAVGLAVALALRSLDRWETT